MQRPWDGSNRVSQDVSRVPAMMDVWVGSKLRQRRMALGLSLDALSQQVGVTRQQTEKWEKGITRMTAGRIYAVSQAMGVHPGFFFDGHAALPVDTAMATELREITSADGVQMLTAFNKLLPDQRKAVKLIVEAMEKGNLAEQALGKEGAGLMRHTGRTDDDAC